MNHKVNKLKCSQTNSHNFANRGNRTIVIHRHRLVKQKKLQLSVEHKVNGKHWTIAASLFI